MISLTSRLAQLHRSVAARLSGLSATQRYTSHPAHTPPRLESLEDRLLLSATLIVDAGLDLTGEEGSQISVEGTFDDTDAGGGGTPGVFDFVQLTATPTISEQTTDLYFDMDGNRAVWTSNSDILYFDGELDALGAPAKPYVNVTSGLTGGGSVPRISGNYILFNNNGINVYEIDTGTTYFLSSGFDHDIDGSIAVWSNGGRIMMADLDAGTGPVYVDLNAPISADKTQISGNQIIWRAPVGFNYDVFLHDLTTGTTTNISNTPFDDRDAVIDGGVVTWYGKATTDFDIYYFDARNFTGATAPAYGVISSPTTQESIPAVSGANIVYQGDRDVYHYNIDAGGTPIKVSTVASSFSTTPDISGSNIVWSQTTYPDQSDNNVYLYNIDDQSTVQLTSNGGTSALSTSPRVSGNNIAWHSAPFVGGGAVRDLYMAIGQAEAATYTYDWDFGDGTVITDTTLTQDHTYLDNGNYTVTLTINASDGRVSTDTLVAAIDNVAPIVAPIDGPTQALRGTTLNFSGSFTDPGVLDTHTEAWTVTDSAGLVVATGTGSSVEFTPEGVGTFEVTYTVTDKDGGVGSSTLATSSQIIVIGADPLDPSKTTAQIAGSNGRDIIYVTKSRSTVGAIKIIVKEVDNNCFKTVVDDIVGVDHIIADGRGGNDLVKVRRGLGDLTSELYGSEGNDWLRGGSASDFISGGDGNDLLSGGSGRDFLVGGLGKDIVVGHNDDDILVGGVYSEDRNLAAVRAVMAEWTRTDLGYSDRVANLTNGTGLNGSHVLDGTTVFDDNSWDLLLGLRGLDWFHANDCQDWTDQRRYEHLTESENDYVDNDPEDIV